MNMTLLPPFHMTIGYGEINNIKSLFAVCVPAEFISQDMELNVLDIKVEIEGYNLEEMQKTLQTSIEFFQLGRISVNKKPTPIIIDEAISSLLIKENPSGYLNFIKDHSNATEELLLKLEKEILSLPFFSKNKSKSKSINDLTSSFPFNSVKLIEKKMIELLENIRIDIINGDLNAFDQLLKIIITTPEILLQGVSQDFLDLISDVYSLRLKYQNKPMELFILFIKTIINESPMGCFIFRDIAKRLGTELSEDIKNILREVGISDFSGDDNDDEDDNENNQEEFINKKIIQNANFSN